MQSAANDTARNWRWWAEVHRIGRPMIDVTPAVISGTTRKTLGEPAGSFTLTMKSSFNVGLDGGDLLHFISDDDWVVVGATDGDGTDWVIMVGLVDSIRRSRAGSAAATTYTVQGRDLGKVFLKSDMLDMPWLATSYQHGEGNSFVAYEHLNGVKPRTPGWVVREMTRYVLSDDPWRGSRRRWAVPETLVFSGETPRDLSNRQVIDVISLKHVDTETLGDMPSLLDVPTGIGQGGSLWAILSQYANPLLNEIHYDLIAPARALGAPDAYQGRGERVAARPSLRLRQKPFPSLQQSVADGVSDFGDVVGSIPPELSSPWRALPVSSFPEAHLESYDVGRSGAERFNWFLVEAGGGDDLIVRGATAMLHGDGVSPDKLWDSLPAVLLPSIERHGRCMLQQSSAYIDPELGKGAVWTSQQWVRLLRDWYAPNPEFLSGTATIAYLAPGVRIGERFRVAMRDSSVEEFYIEGVEHRFTKRSDGSAHGSTVVSVTRGWQLDGPSADYTAEVQSWLRSNFGGGE